jgi:sigma-B regulation protein RsbU (phosphoserine phosphatase)
VTPTELIEIAIGCTLTALGLTSIGAWGLRRRVAERLLLWFGIWCLLYGIRLIAAQPAVQGSIGGSGRTWTYVIGFITYGINVPSVLFFEALIGVGWKQSIRRVWQLQIGYTAAAIVTDLVTGRPYTAMPLNNPLVLAGLTVVAANVWLYRRRLSKLFTTPILVGCALALVLSVINENLGRPFLSTIDLEPVGVLVFVVALAYGVVGTVVRGEAELLAVQRELKTAREIQRSLLPQEAPRMPGLDVAVEFVPMTAVAGDLYDFADLGPSKIGILVADVSGHGIPAAMVASMVKLAFSTQAEQAHDPARVIAGVNRALCRQLKQGFVTAVYAVIDLEIHEHGLLLGLQPDASYANAEVELRQGDLILLYTDGVTEAQNAAEEFFDGERVKSWLTSTNRGDAARFRDAALAHLVQWRGDSTFNDDVTFVVARVTTARADPLEVKQADR